MQINKKEIGKHPFLKSEKNISASGTLRGRTYGHEYALSFVLLKQIL